MLQKIHHCAHTKEKWNHMLEWLEPPLLWHPSSASVLRNSSETTSALCCLPHWIRYNLHIAATVPQTMLLPSPCTLLSPTWKIRTPMWGCCSWIIQPRESTGTDLPGSTEHQPTTQRQVCTPEKTFNKLTLRGIYRLPLVVWFFTPLQDFIQLIIIPGQLKKWGGGGMPHGRGGLGGALVPKGWEPLL